MRMIIASIIKKMQVAIYAVVVVGVQVFVNSDVRKEKKNVIAMGSILGEDTMLSIPPVAMVDEIFDGVSINISIGIVMVGAISQLSQFTPEMPEK